MTALARHTPKHIAVVGINYAPEEIGIARYTTDMARALVRNGHTVDVLAGKPYYPAWEVPKAWRGGGWRRGDEHGVHITRCPHYVPRSPNGLRRILHLMSFAAAALPPALRMGRGLARRPGVRRHRPQVVLCVAPALLSLPVAWVVARLSRAPLWVHVQDFEVEAAFATDLMRADGMAARLARWVEGRLLHLADFASSISPQMCQKLLEKGFAQDQVTEIRNWADTAMTVMPSASSPYRQEWHIGNRKVCLYSGNIANKQGIEILIEVARLLQHRSDVVFVICGQGPNREKLEALADGLDNVQFHNLQPMDRMPQLLSLASVHLLPQIPGAADLVLPSKLTNMLMSGRPVVATASQGTGLYDEVDGCGLCTAPGDAGAMAQAVERLLDDTHLAEALGAQGVKRAAERWSQEAIIDKLETYLEKLARPA